METQKRHIHIECSKNKKEYNRLYSERFRNEYNDYYKKIQKEQYEKNKQSRLEYQRQYDRKNYKIKYEKTKERYFMNKYGNVMSEFLDMINSY